MTRTFFASAPRGCEAALAAELESVGASRVAPMPGGVRFCGDLSVGYRALFESRVASRVLLQLAQWPSGDAQALYQQVQMLPLDAHMNPTDTLAVDVHIAQSEHLRHPHFVAQKVKDAICDWFRAHDSQGRRPSVDLDQPDHRFFVFIGGRYTELSLDLAGSSLHRRGYRVAQGAAPLKENVAAAILLRAGWPAIAQAGGALVDPMSGSGTLAIEAALIALDIVPGLLRPAPTVVHWKGHDPQAWEEVVANARARATAGKLRQPTIFACDRDPAAVASTRACVAAAGLVDVVAVHHADALEVPAPAAQGLLVCNPPWGLRLGDEAQAGALFAQLGASLQRNFRGWQAVLLTGSPHLGLRLGMQAKKRWDLDNGGVACQVLHLDLTPAALDDPRRQPKEKTPLAPPPDLLNRLRKNLKNLATWREREKVEAYRLYDSDLPEYAVAVDVYGDHAHVQEYAPPPEIPDETARKRLNEALAAVRAALDLPRERVHVKQRRRQHQREGEQYQKMAQTGTELEVAEGRAKFLVNLDDYLDTGLFLDHRPIRLWLADHAQGKRVLNLFCYTASATVQAVLGGARASTSVDTSATYLEWAARNFRLNGITDPRHDPRHELVRADAREWLQRHAHLRYDVIFLDPPTFSNSKRSTATFDVQRDHLALLDEAMALLDDQGTLIFSTNARRFKLDEAVSSDYDVEDWTTRSIGPDFARNSKIHRCFCLRWPLAAANPDKTSP